MLESFDIRTQRQGLHEITHKVEAIVARSDLAEGLCTVFIRHTSASLLIQENADPTAARDLERWLLRLVPESDKSFQHTAEGSDDMPAHIKAALTATSLGIPVLESQMTLGTWQGIYLWEHRRHPHTRQVIVQLIRGS